jgi:hypothetical protein
MENQVKNQISNALQCVTELLDNKNLALPWTAPVQMLHSCPAAVGNAAVPAAIDGLLLLLLLLSGCFALAASAVR